VCVGGPGGGSPLALEHSKVCTLIIYIIIYIIEFLPCVIGRDSPFSNIYYSNERIAPG
jgi:hypothetical protein